jgi:hypothetical protein
MAAVTRRPPFAFPALYNTGKGNMQSSYNSFFKFVLGFSVFIVVSLGLTVVVSQYSIKQEQQKQTAAAMKAMLNQAGETQWWEFWKN